jgi:hypothetical protein
MSVRTSPNSITPTQEARPLKLASPPQRRRQQKNADRSKKNHYKSSKNTSGSHGIHQRHVSCLDNLEKHEIVEACNCSVLEIHQKHLCILHLCRRVTLPYLPGNRKTLQWSEIRSAARHKRPARKHANVHLTNRSKITSLS